MQDDEIQHDLAYLDALDIRRRAEKLHLTQALIEYKIFEDVDALRAAVEAEEARRASS